MNALREWLAQQAYNAINSFDFMFTHTRTILTTSGPGSVLHAWESLSVSHLVLAIQAFATIIIAICMLIEIANVLQRVDTLTWEMGIRLGLKLSLSMVAIQVAPDLFIAMYLQAQQLILLGMADFSFAWITVYGGIVRDQINNVTGMWMTIAMLAAVLITTLAIHITTLIIIAIAIGRMFELLVYFVISPIPVAFLPLGDGSGGGWNRLATKFIRSMGAAALHGVVMVVVLKVFNMAVSVVSFNMFYEYITVNAPGDTSATRAMMLMFIVLIVTLSMVAAITKSGSWAKSIMDAS